MFLKNYSYIVIVVEGNTFSLVFSNPFNIITMSDITKKLSSMSDLDLFEYYEKLLIRQDYDFSQDLYDTSTEEISRTYQSIFSLIFKEFQKRGIDYSGLLTKGDLPF